MPGGAIAVASGHAGFDLKKIAERVGHAGAQVCAAAVRKVVPSSLSWQHKDIGVVAFYGHRPIGPEAARASSRVVLSTNSVVAMLAGSPSFPGVE